MSSACSCGRPTALSARQVARPFPAGLKRLAFRLVLLLSTAASATSSSSSSSSTSTHEDGWVRLDKIGCKDETSEAIMEVAWWGVCESECGKRSECLAYSYNGKTERCFLKETPCEDRQPENADRSGIKAPPGSAAEVTSVLWNFRQALDCFDSDCRIADWNLLSDTCDWRGVSCRGSQAHTIRKLDLSKCGLRGQLPPDFAKLTAMEEMNLSANYLYGKLPSGWELPELTSLDLSGNQLSGYLPWLWSSNLPEIMQLKLSKNLLIGRLPGSWWQMKYLNTLDVSDNLLTGTLPTLWSGIGAKRLYLNGNELSGPMPHEWTEIQSLNELSVCNNQLYSTVPQEWITWFLTTGIELCLFPQRSGPRAVPPSVVTADLCSGGGGGDGGGEVQSPPAVYSGWVGEVFDSGSAIDKPSIPCPDDSRGDLCLELCAEECRQTENCNAFVVDYLSCSLHRDVFAVYHDLCDDCTVSVCLENCPAGTTPYYYTSNPWVCVEDPVRRIALPCGSTGKQCNRYLECYLACKANDEWCNRFFITSGGADGSVTYCDLYSTCDNSDYDYDEVYAGRFRLTEAEEAAYLAGLASA